MASPAYLPVSLHLPYIYQEDQASFEQVDSYLGLVDDLHRAYLDRLSELGHWLSPQATDLWPPDLPLDAGSERLADSYLRLFDELASWVAFRFPGGWSREDAGVVKRRRFLLEAARTWRRRGTPRGFLDWFAFAFDIADDERPVLVEHFTVADPAVVENPPPWLRATMFIPSTARFAGLPRRREAVAFIDRYAPAHVRVRVCWIKPEEDLPEPPETGATDTAIADFRAAMRTLLCSFVSLTGHAAAVHVRECVDEGEPGDRLGVGRLPGGGESPID